MGVATILYGDKKIIPAPFITIDKSYQKAADGTNIGAQYSINMAGNLVSWRGSPNSSGVFWQAAGYPPDESLGDVDKFNNILRKQEALRTLFATEGLSLEITPCSGMIPLKCNPRVISVNFAEGPWVDVCPYNISLEADVILGQLIVATGEDNYNNIYVSEASENWSLEFAEEAESVNNPHTFRLTHQVSAKGKRFYDNAGNLVREAWEQARNYVQPKLGLDLDKLHASGSVRLPSYYQGFNHIRSESINELDGQYAITETWILSSGSAFEDFNISTKASKAEPLTIVTIEGTIKGLEVMNYSGATSFVVSGTKWASATGYFNSVTGQFLTRVNLYSPLSVTLNTVPANVVVGRNPVAGTINYSYEYNNRPSNVIANSLSEIITLSDKNPTDVFAKLIVLGRTDGPVLQDINTKTESNRTVTAEVIMPFTAGNPSGDVRAYLLTFAPTTSLNGLRVFKSQDEETFIANQGRYTLSLGWTY